MPVGFGSYVKPQPVSVRAGDVPKFGDLSMQEKLLMVGAALQGDTQGAMSVPMLAAARKRQADESAWRSGLAEAMQGVPMKRERAIPNAEGQDISAAFSPQMETVRGQPATLRDLVPLLSKGAASGYDIKPWMELAEKTGPSIKFERGVRYDERDPSSAPDFIPDLDKGQRLTADGRIENIPGFVPSQAESAGAVTSAQEAAKAGYDMVDVSVGGQKVQLPRAVALPLITKAFAEANGGALPENFGVSESPAEQAYDVDAAKAQVEREFTRPKAESALNAYEAKAKVVTDAIKRAKGMVGNWTAGAGSMLSSVPGTPARDLKATIEIIKANLGFDELQTMRDNSPTGGALGQVAVQELEALRSTIDSLDQAQSPEQLEAALERLEKFYEGSGTRKRDAFTRTYAPTPPKSAGARKARSGLSAIPLEERIAEARRRGLIQ